MRKQAAGLEVQVSGPALVFGTSGSEKTVPGGGNVV